MDGKRYWKAVYDAVFYLDAHTMIKGVWFTVSNTCIVMYYDWNPVNRSYDSDKRFYYVFRDGTVGRA